MKCSYCGTEIGNARECPQCGTVQGLRSPDLSHIQAYGQSQFQAQQSGGGGADDVGKQLGSQKTQKSIKSFSGMLGKLTKVNPYTIALEKIMILIEPFISLIDLFNPVLEYLAGIFEQMLIPVIQALMPLIMLFIDILDQLKPMFLTIGEILGNYVGKIVQAIIPIIMALFEVVKPFLPLIEELTPLFDLLFLLMFPFLPLLEALVPLIELLVPVVWALVHAIRWIISAIKDANEAIDKFIGWIDDVAKTVGSLSGGGGKGGGGGKKEKEWWDIFQEGTPFVPQTGPAIVHRGEAVIPAESNPFTTEVSSPSADPELLMYSENTARATMEMNERMRRRQRHSIYGGVY